MVAYLKDSYFPDKLQLVALPFKHFRSVRAKKRLVIK